jgi:DHA1 family multidrug resistance protein-like MFS transporter
MSHNPQIGRHMHFGKRKFPKRVTSLPLPIKKLSFIFFFYMFGWGVVQPFISIYTKQVVGDYSSLGLIYFIFYLASTIWCIPFGKYIDIASRKKSIMLIFFFYIFIGPLFLLVDGFLSMLFLKIYHGILTSSIWSSADCYVRYNSPKRKTAESIGFFDSLYTLGLVFGCFLGGFLFIYVGFYGFLFISFFALVSLFLSKNLPDRKRKFHFVKGIKSAFKISLFKKEFQFFFVKAELVKLTFLSFFMIFARSIINMLLPLFVYEKGSSFIVVGLIMGIYNLPRIFESFFSHIADNNSKKLFILIGSLYATCFFVLLFFVHSQIVLFILTFFISLAFALINPAIEGALTTVIPKKKVGELSGAVRTIKMSAEALGPLFAGFISDLFGINYAFLFGGIIMLSLFCLGFFIQNYDNRN